MLEQLRLSIIANALGNDFECKQLNSAVQQFLRLPISDVKYGLNILSNDDDPHCRSQSVVIASRNNIDTAPILVERLLNDPIFYVRLEACHAARRLNCSILAKRIAQLLLDDPDEIVRATAALALSKIGDMSIVPLMEQAAETEIGEDHEGAPVRDTIRRSVQTIKNRVE